MGNLDAEFDWQSGNRRSPRFQKRLVIFSLESLRASFLAAFFDRSSEVNLQLISSEKGQQLNRVWLFVQGKRSSLESRMTREEGT